jgi:hypothetical protein
MATHRNSLEPTRVECAGTLNLSAESADEVIGDPGTWLAQATRVREAALRLMLERFGRDLTDVQELVGRSDQNAFASQIDYANKLTASYVAESERMFELISRLARDGWVETRQSQ